MSGDKSGTALAIWPLGLHPHPQWDGLVEVLSPAHVYTAACSNNQRIISIINIISGELNNWASKWLNNSCPSNFLPGYGPVHSSPDSTPWKAYSFAAIAALELFRHTSSHLSKEASIHSWVERVHIRWSTLLNDTVPRRGSWDPYLRSFAPSRRPYSYHATMPCMYMEYTF